MSLEQKIFEYLVRTSHPVFIKDYSETQDQDSSFNTIYCRIVAKQLVEIYEALGQLKKNAFPNTVLDDGIGAWENRYFEFQKSGKAIENRRSELQDRINKRIGMSYPETYNLIKSIAGVDPIVHRNSTKVGWVLGQSVLGVDTILRNIDNQESRQTYTVIIREPLSTRFINLIDKELTRIEKSGSKHSLLVNSKKWVLGESALGIDTVLR